MNWMELIDDDWRLMPWYKKRWIILRNRYLFFKEYLIGDYHSVEKKYLGAKQFREAYHSNRKWLLKIRPEFKRWWEKIIYD